LFGIGQGQVPEHIAGAGFELSAIKSAICHLVSTLYTRTGMRGVCLD
jgi:hypothetical protein